MNYYHTYLKPDPVVKGKYDEHPCYEKIDNCAICGGNAGNKCVMCFDLHVLVNITKENGDIAQQCTDACPLGYR